MSKIISRSVTAFKRIRQTVFFTALAGMLTLVVQRAILVTNLAKRYMQQTMYV